MQEPAGDEPLLPLPATLDQAAVVSSVTTHIEALVDIFAEEVDRSILPAAAPGQTSVQVEPEKRPLATCLAVLPTPTASVKYPYSAHKNCFSGVGSKGRPVYESEKVVFQVISTKDQWAVQAVMRLMPSCYLRYGYKSHAFIRMQ